jgi:hypothetical protein
MFDSKTSLAALLSDAVDLLIDFATLGEYGLEPAGRPASSCESRQRQQPASPIAGRAVDRSLATRH